MSRPAMPVGGVGVVCGLLLLTPVSTLITALVVEASVWKSRRASIAPSSCQAQASKTHQELKRRPVTAALLLLCL